MLQELAFVCHVMCWGAFYVLELGARGNVLNFDFERRGSLFRPRRSAHAMYKKLTRAELELR